MQSIEQGDRSDDARLSIGQGAREDAHGREESQQETYYTQNADLMYVCTTLPCCNAPTKDTLTSWVDDCSSIGSAGQQNSIGIDAGVPQPLSSSFWTIGSDSRLSDIALSVDEFNGTSISSVYDNDIQLARHKSKESLTSLSEMIHRVNLLSLLMERRDDPVKDQVSETVPDDISSEEFPSRPCSSSLRTSNYLRNFGLTVVPVFKRLSVAPPRGSVGIEEFPEESMWRKGSARIRKPRCIILIALIVATLLAVGITLSLILSDKRSKVRRSLESRPLMEENAYFQIDIWQFDD